MVGSVMLCELENEENQPPLESIDQTPSGVFITKPKLIRKGTTPELSTIDFASKEYSLPTKIERYSLDSILEQLNEVKSRCDKLEMENEQKKKEDEKRYKCNEKIKNALGALRKDHDDLKKSHEDLKKNHDDDLKKKHDDLRKNHDDLKKNHDDLIKKHDDLRKDYEDLKKENKQAFSNLVKVSYSLLLHYNRASKEAVQIADAIKAREENNSKLRKEIEDELVNIDRKYCLNA